MIKVLILYYLSLKSTHGYEIQKFIQVNHMDSWTKIQSGSIYYALAKLEKEGLIELHGDKSTGPKARKTYAITPKGRDELRLLVKNELNSPICEVGSDKFILYPLLTAADRNEIERGVVSHIAELEKKKSYIEKWRRVKVSRNTLEVEKISFEMMISSLSYQIRWHQALLSQLDLCIEGSGETAKLIGSYDFSDSKVVSSDDVSDLDGLISQTLNR